jgi:hypothetical protein
MEEKMLIRMPITEIPKRARKQEYRTPCTTSQLLAPANTYCTPPESVKLGLKYFSKYHFCTCKLPSFTKGSIIPAEQVHVCVMYWNTHSLSVCNRFMWMTVVVIVMTTQRMAEQRHNRPQVLICKEVTDK